MGLLDSNKLMADTAWRVRYLLPTDQVRTPREIIVQANGQSDAARVAQAMLPGARIVGGPQRA